jgi:hypothetical protein
MSDPDTPHNRTPLSSSATTPSGTSALRIVDSKPPQQGNEQLAQPAEPAPAEPAMTAETPAPDAPAEQPSEAEMPEASQAPEPAEASEPVESPEPQASPEPFSEVVAETVSAPIEVAEDALAATSDAGSEMAAQMSAAPEADIPAPEAPIPPVVAAEAVHDAVVDAMAVNEEAQDKVATIFDQVSRSFKAAFTDAGSDAALITFTLLEFAQANARNNYQLAQDYAGARSVPEIVNVQAAYFKRQMELMNRQAGELQKVAAEITSKKAAQMQGRITRH